MYWYDKIASLYDASTAWLYKRARVTLIENLEIKKGSRILVIACGTGQSFELLEKKLQNSGEIIAIDYSAGMLKIAQKKIKKHNWPNIRLINMDARDLNSEYLLEKNIKPSFDVILAELAFSVIPDWEKVMKSSASLLSENGEFGLLDWYRSKNNWLTKLVDYLAKAETTRDTISLAREIFTEFTVIKKFLFNNVYVAIGKRQKLDK